MQRKGIKYKGGFKYQLTEEYTVFLRALRPSKTIKTDFISLDVNGFLKIKAGYAWDGASGPARDTKTIMRGSLVHDALYQLIRTSMLPINRRLDADEELYNICIEDGMWKVRAWWVRRAVQKLGLFAVDTAYNKPEHEAP